MPSFYTYFLPLLALPLVSASIHNNVNYRPYSTNPYHNVSVLIPDVRHLELKIRKRQESGGDAFLDGYFSSGIASGDPATDSVVLWTRFAPCSAVKKASTDDYIVKNRKSDGDYPWPTYAPKPINPANDGLMTCVKYKIWLASDADGESKADFGPEAYTSAEIDWTVKFIPDGLNEFTSYKYRFYQCGKETTVMSTIGNTKTLPDQNNPLANGLKFTMYTCANMPWGFFNAYDNVVKKQSRQPDYIIFLGDYIYEFQAGAYEHPNAKQMGRRSPISYGMTKLSDFRGRYLQYKSDKNLQDNHAAFPWIAIWDDHEMGDNAWNEGMTWWAYRQYTGTPGGRPAFTDVKHNSVRAYFEYMPIRQQQYENNLRIWRQFQMGNLINLMMLDTREYDRDISQYTGAARQQLTQSLPGYTEDTDGKAYTAHRKDPDPIDSKLNPAPAGAKTRTMMGADQEKWFKETFEKSTSTWQIIGNQVIFSAAYGGGDSWHGYAGTRTNMMNWIAGQPNKRTVILTGDSHQNWAHDIVRYNINGGNVGTYDATTGKGAIAVEFALTGLSSPPPGTNNGDNTAYYDYSWYYPSSTVSATKSKAGLKWQHWWTRGYMEMDVTKDNIKTRYIGTPCMTSQNNYERLLAEFQVDHTDNHIKRFNANGALFPDGKFGAGGVPASNPGTVVAESAFAVTDAAKGTQVTILPVTRPGATSAVQALCLGVPALKGGTYQVFTPAAVVPSPPAKCPALAAPAKVAARDALPERNEAYVTTTRQEVSATPAPEPGRGHGGPRRHGKPAPGLKKRRAYRQMMERNEF